MIKLLQILSRKAAQAPGTLTLVGEQKMGQVTIRRMDYSPEKYEEYGISTEEPAFSRGKEGMVSWIDVTGIHDLELIKRLCDDFSIHPLTQEDIVNTFHRPKVEEIEDYIFVVLRTFYHENGELQTNSINLVLGSNYVISFQEKKSGIFDPVRERIRKGVRKIRERSADYLAYSLVDAAVDYGYVTLERLAREAEDLEEQVMTAPGREIQIRIHSTRQQIGYFRKSIWPMREVLSSLLRGESPLIRRATLLYFRDVYDHTVSIIETAESLRDQIAGLRDLYLAEMSNRMNEIMKTLTIFAALFIPLTFIVGVYGMNFEFMPELKWRLGYLSVWVVILAVAGFMVVYFKRKKWW
jgi:magnesium transporter